MPHTSNDPLVTQTDDFANDGASIGTVSVQNKSAEYGAKSAGNTSTEREVLDRELLTVEAAAALIGIDPKRLRGYIWRNKIGDPIGDFHHVYGWSLEETRKRLANDSSVVTGGQ